MPCYDERSIDYHSVLCSNFSNIKAIGRGCNGFVLSAVENTGGNNTKVALKRLSLRRKSHCRAAIRELRILKRLDHENIVKNFNTRTPNGCEVDDLNAETLRDMNYVYLVEELLDTDLHNIIDRTGRLPEKIAKLFLYQILRALKYIHSANVVHRDIKPGNLFINVEDLTLKVGDFGLGRILDPKYNHAGYLTELVTTRYYRAPEVILSPGNYGKSIDIWSCGCVFAEMCTGNVLFPGENDLSQIDCIQSWFQAEGSSSGRFQAHKLSGFSQAGLDILQKMLRLDPLKRLSAAQLLEDPYFGDISDITDEPVCPASNVFHIEHEVDDLPMEALRNMIATECCSGRSAFDSELFENFDENFEIETQKMTHETEKDMSMNSLSNCYDDICPLSKVITSSFDDEPFRDPGCLEARSSEMVYDCDVMSISTVSADHCSPNFPRTSTTLESKFPKSSLTLNTEKCVFTAPVECRRFSKLAFPSTSFHTNSKNVFQPSRIEKDILNINKLHARSVDNRRNCRIAEFSASEHFRGNKFHGHFNHWDPIRIWI